MTMDVNVGLSASGPIQKPSTDLYRACIKRGLDLALLVLAAPVVVPLVTLLVLLVAAFDGRPFYSQLRVGKGGRAFRMWKLRTMVLNADDALEAHLAEHASARAEWDAFQKLTHDPRITWIGRILRATSLDELPQLWNVATGDMSLVGPRPMMISQREAYPGNAYYNLRPGLTGAWQVSSRNESTFAERAEFDVTYDRELSFWTDLSILAVTPAVVLRATGR